MDESESELEARARQGGWLDPPPGQHVDVRTKVTLGFVSSWIFLFVGKKQRSEFLGAFCGLLAGLQKS